MLWLDRALAHRQLLQGRPLETRVDGNAGTPHGAAGGMSVFWCGPPARPSGRTLVPRPPSHARVSRQRPSHRGHDHDVWVLKDRGFGLH
ncbi:hypothetical protein DYB35_004698 [Aphanomyces astaci]|uniref:Uncharacterized protein n=1 Tax=Aphanomyces astaci TaxID=112090 RepID=A0A3R7AAT4_APHAT|nr:hypothetical protein DYB35_004698 [Aphanomyces astaci]